MRNFISWSFSQGAVDQQGRDRIQAWAVDTKRAVDEGKFLEAQFGFSETARIVLDVTNNIDFYNVLRKIHGWSSKQTLSKLKKVVCDICKNNKLLLRICYLIIA